MKKNLLYSMLAVCLMLFASCSQEEILSTNGGNNGDNIVRLTVNVTDMQPATRAALDVDGHVMRCIAQAVNADGTLIDGFNEKAEVVNGAANFEFEAPEGVATYLFWADYVIGSDYTATGSEVEYYNATKLTSVGYQSNKRTALFNNEALDAFCANVAASGISSLITLKRPLTRISVRRTEPKLEGLDIIAPNINGARSFNVANGTCAEAVTLTPTTADNVAETVDALTSGDYSFFCYVFVEDNITKNSTIKFTSATDETGRTLSLTADEMKKLDSNTHFNLVPKEDGGGDEPGDDNIIEVDIVIDSEYDETQEPADPNALKVGDYINAAGEKVTDASSAVAVVYALAGKTDNSNYGSKTVKAYAISLSKAIAGRSALGNTYDTDLQLAATAVDYSGYEFTSAIEAAMSSHTASDYPAFNAFFNNNELTDLTGANLSDWYIPSITQLEDALAYSADNATLKANLMETHTSNYYLASSSVVENNLVRGIIYNTDGTYGKAQNITNSASAYIFGFVTIFAD